MPVLKNDRQEIYAKHRARGMVPTKAALAAGYAAGSSVTHLEADEDIIARIHELMNEMEDKRAAQRAAATEAGKMVGQMTGIGRAWVISKLAENSQRAADDGDYKESNHALEMIGKEFGMFVGDRSGDDQRPDEVPFDLDKLDAVLTSAENAMPKELPKPGTVVTEEDIMGLIEGHGRKPDMANDRQIPMGSEVDVSFMDNGEIDDEDETEHPGLRIDPETGEWEEVDENE